MATSDTRDQHAKDSNLGTHPDGVDPSAPTVGTEGWGSTPDEKRVLTPNAPQNSGAGLADLSRPTGGSANSNASQKTTAHIFRCSDAGNSDCRWEAAGDTQDEVMQKAVEHARDAHGMHDWTDALRERVRDSIHHREAA